MNELIKAAGAIATEAVAPATKLIEEVAKGIGGIYRPLGIILNATAEAKASLISAEAEIEKRALIERAAHRIGYVEIRRQKNIESITEQAKKELPERVSPDPVSEDWMVQFFENCKDIGEPELQKLWARLLAGEVTQPRTFSRRTLESLKTFEPADAVAFSTFADLGFKDGEGQPFMFASSFLNDQLSELDHGKLELHLVSIGLLNAEKTFISAHVLRGYRVYYFGEVYEIKARGIFGFVSSPMINDYGLWVRTLTRTGQELFNLVKPTRNVGLVKLLNVGLKMEEIELVPVTAQDSSEKKGANGPAL